MKDEASMDSTNLDRSARGNRLPTAGTPAEVAQVATFASRDPIFPLILASLPIPLTRDRVPDTLTGLLKMGFSTESLL